MLSFLRNTSPTRLAIFLLLAVVGYRFWFATHIGLVADEAYYWLWSKHLAASYRDKGPAIAWTIALGTKMFGDTVFGIRFFAVLLSGGVGWLIFVLPRQKKVVDHHRQVCMPQRRQNRGLLRELLLRRR